jgi:hypothetical protein
MISGINSLERNCQPTVAAVNENRMAGRKECHLPRSAVPQCSPACATSNPLCSIALGAATYFRILPRVQFCEERINRFYSIISVWPLMNRAWKLSTSERALTLDGEIMLQIVKRGLLCASSKSPARLSPFFMQHGCKDSGRTLSSPS